MPVPRGAQDEPFQRAMRLALTPPAEVNRPPAIKSPLGSMVSAYTSGLNRPPVPMPNGAQVEPFQRAMWLALTPPAEVNWPPATRSPLESTASAQTALSIPVPRAIHVEPSQRAMEFALTPPAMLNEPPATRSPFGITVSA